MYDQASITALAESVGFGQSTGSILTEGSNLLGSSGMLFSSFHSLVTPDNLISTIPKDKAEDQTKFNVVLDIIREDQAKKVLASIFDEHLEFEDETDYSGIITTKLTLLRKPFALSVAVHVLETMISSKRFGLAERSIRETFAYLKIELEGSKSDSGKRISYGVVDKLRFSISDAQDVIFPPDPIVESENQW